MKTTSYLLALPLFLLLGISMNAQELTVERNEEGGYSGRIFKRIKTDVHKFFVNKRTVEYASLSFETGLNVYNGKEDVMLRFKETKIEEGKDQIGLTYFAPHTEYYGGSTGNEIIAEGTAVVAFVWAFEGPFVVALEFRAERYSEAEAGVRKLEEITRDEVGLLEDLFSKGMDWFYNQVSPGNKTKTR
ncbi:MAG: hypothetical protein JXA28_01640 [Bacteroidetes bacterium]|nr:hypothetical protein [Bacteroidota bacterium]